jgi:hypothetical protein
LTVHGSSTASTQENVYGTLKGNVIDNDTNTPLIGANVILVGTNRGAFTDTEGIFVIKNVPIGSYILHV